MQDWITAVIGVCGTVAGTAAGYRGAFAISRDERKAAMRERMRVALADYFGECVVSVAELRDLPPNKDPNWFDKLINDLRGEQANWLARRRAEYRLTGDRYRELAAGLARAAIQLRALPLPSEARAAVDAATNYVERLGQDRSPEIFAEWPEIHRRLSEAIASLNEGPQLRWRFSVAASDRRPRVRSYDAPLCGNIPPHIP